MTRGGWPPRKSPARGSGAKSTIGPAELRRPANPPRHYHSRLHSAETAPPSETSRRIISRKLQQSSDRHRVSHKGTSNNVRGHKFGLGPIFDCLPGFFFRPLLRLEHCRVGRSLRGISRLWWKLRYQFRPNSLHHGPYFLRDGLEGGRINHVTMDCLQLGRHEQLAANNAGLIGKALAISSWGAGLRSSFC